MVVASFELALKDDDPNDYLSSERELRSFTLQAGLNPRDPQDVRQARRYLEERAQELHPKPKRGKPMVPLKPKDPMDRRPRAEKAPGVLTAKAQELEARRVFEHVRNRPDVSESILKIQDLMRQARFARTQGDAQVLVDTANRLGADIYTQYVQEAQRRKLSLGPEHPRAAGALHQYHRRVLDSIGYFDKDHILANKPVTAPAPATTERDPFSDGAPSGVRGTVKRTWLGAGRGLRKAGRTASEGTQWVSDQGTRFNTHFGRKAGPLGAFVAVVRLYNRQARRVALLGLLIGILFIPTGFFTFSGWSIVALAMVITSAAYFFLLNVVKVTASIAVASLNAVFSLLIGLVVRAFEWVLAGLGKPATPCTIGQATVRTTFCSGHQLAAEGLIPASELHAINISLLDAEALKPRMSTKPLIEFFGEWTGLYDIDIGTSIGRAFGPRFQDWLEHGNLYAVIAVFFLPLAALVVVAYLKLLRPALQDAGVIGGA